MKDQVDALTARGIPATFVNSTLTERRGLRAAWRASMRGEVKLLYVAPERFDVGTTAERLRDVGVSLLAVDEAHCISEWGHDFRPSYLRIAQVRERLGWPPTVALTATATPHVRADIVASAPARESRDDHHRVRSAEPPLSRRAARAPTPRRTTRSSHVLREHEGVAVVYASTRERRADRAHARARADSRRGVPRRARRRRIATRCRTRS